MVTSPGPAVGTPVVSPAIGTLVSPTVSTIVGAPVSTIVSGPVSTIVGAPVSTIIGPAVGHVALRALVGTARDAARTRRPSGVDLVILQRHLFSFVSCARSR
jgi:hypothetical protein